MLTLHRANLPRRQAFTLVELLVVIAVIAILASLILPSLARAKEQARTTICTSNVRQMMLAMSMYVNEYTRYPSVYTWGPDPNYLQYWQDSLTPYLTPAKTNTVFRCPSYKHFPPFRADAGLVWIPYAVYGYNSQTPYSLSRSPTEAIDHASNYVKESAIAVPSQMIALGDSHLSAPTFPKGAIVGDTELKYMPITYREKLPNYPLEQAAIKKRHHGRHVISFCDGHVERIPYARLFANNSDARRRWNIDHRPHPTPFD